MVSCEGLVGVLMWVDNVVLEPRPTLG